MWTRITRVGAGSQNGDQQETTLGGGCSRMARVSKMGVSSQGNHKTWNGGGLGGGGAGVRLICL